MNLRRYGFAVVLAALVIVGTPLVSIGSAGGISGAIYTTTKDGTAVNQNIYGAPEDVYLGGGPQNTKATGLPDGTYYFQVTNPSGSTLLSSDNAACRQLQVVGGRIAGSTGPACKHANGTLNPANGTLPVQLAPFDETPNAGKEYKAWLIPAGRATISGSDPKVLVFARSDAKTDNFKANAGPPVVQGSCQPSSSLSVLVSGSNVVSYVPKGAVEQRCDRRRRRERRGDQHHGHADPHDECRELVRLEPAYGPDRVHGQQHGRLRAEGHGTRPRRQPEPAYERRLRPALLLRRRLHELRGGDGRYAQQGTARPERRRCRWLPVPESRDGGVRGAIRLDGSGRPIPANISENPLVDPIRNLLLSAAETNNYEIADVTNTTTPAFYENGISWRR